MICLSKGAINEKFYEKFGFNIRDINDVVCDE